MEVDDIESSLPSAFGKKSKMPQKKQKNQKNKDIAINQIQLNPQELLIKCKDRKKLPEIGPILPRRTEKPKFPTTQEFQIGQKSNISITSIYVNKEASMLYTGGSQCTICYYNLNTMDVFGKKCENMIQLNDSYDVNCIDVAGGDKYVAVATGSPIIRVFNEKGLKVQQSKVGDMYLYDTTNTEGHTAAVTGLQYCPIDTTILASCSLDGTLRFWNAKRLDHKPRVFRLSSPSGVRNPAYGLCWSRNGEGVYVSSNDGHVSYYNYKQAVRGPEFQFDCRRKERRQGNTVPGRVICLHDKYICTREHDNTNVLFWDIRNTEQPIWDFQSRSISSGLSIGPNNTVLIPESVPRGSKLGGSIKFVSQDTGELVNEVFMASTIGVNVCTWKRATNQIYCGCSDGIVRILFDNEISQGGIMKTLERGVSLNKQTDEAAIGTLLPHLVDTKHDKIINGFWFPGKSDKEKKNEIFPQAPIYGNGYKGQIGSHPYQRELSEISVYEKPGQYDIVESIRSHGISERNEEEDDDENEEEEK